MTEEWKVYHKGPRVTWEVSSEGRVKRNGVLYEPKINKGYFAVGYGSIHRMIAKLFIPNPNNYNEIDHINGNPLDNRVVNLHWCTHKQNCNNPITRKRRSESLKGKNTGSKSEETRKRISQSLKGKNTGSKSEETRKLISQSMKGKNKDKHRVYHEDGSYHMEY